MVGAALLSVFLLIATYTDVRWRIIHNRTTYAGLLVALVASAAASWVGVDTLSGTADAARFWGLVPLRDSVTGCLACGAAMLVCYVFFARDVGGGDLKLIAMMGAFLGPYDGLEAMLWTMIIGGCMALMILVWRVGFWSLASLCFRYLAAAARGARPELTDEQRHALRTDLFLSPSALLAVMMVWWLE